MDSQNTITDFLEANVLEWNETFDYTRQIKQMMGQNMSETGQQEAIWEIDALSFMFNNGELKPLHYQSSQDGKEAFEYPSLSKFPPEAFEYFKKRAEQTQNLLLKARYATILWNAPKGVKRNEYAHHAVDAHLLTLDAMNVQNLEDWLDPLQILKSASKVSAQAGKYRTADIKKIAALWLTDAYSTEPNFRLSLIEFMAVSPKIWQPNDITESYNLMIQVMESFISDPNPFTGERAGLLGHTLAIRLKQESKYWYNKLGELSEAYAAERIDEKDKIVSSGQLQKAMVYYQQAGNKKKVKEIGVQYQNLVKNLGLHEIQIPMSDKAVNALWAYNELLSETLLKRDSKDIFEYLAANQEIFPKVSWLRSSTKKHTSDFMDIVTLLSFDINKNLGKRNRTDSDKDKDHLFEHYGFYVGLHISPLLQMIFSNGILQGKITYKKLIHYLTEHSWMGQDLEEANSAGQSRNYNWLGVLAPAMLEYFVQKEAALKSRNVFTNYVLCIDSLTLKFEGILREFAKYIGASTLALGRDGQLRESFTEDLLALDEVKAVFSEDDLLFFKYVFTNAGKNLRNDIAHCYFRSQDYQESQFLLVLAAILRFAKYQVTQEKASV